MSLDTFETNEAEHLLPFEKCQDILITKELIFISCSHLIVINSTNLQLVGQVIYPFHVTHAFFDKGYLTVFGDNQYALYSVLRDETMKLKVEYVLRGSIPDQNYDRFLFVKESGYFLLFSK